MYKNSAAWSIIRDFAKSTTTMLPQAEEQLRTLLGEAVYAESENEWAVPLKAVMDAEKNKDAALAAVTELEAKAAKAIPFFTSRSSDSSSTSTVAQGTNPSAVASPLSTAIPIPSSAATIPPPGLATPDPLNVSSMAIDTPTELETTNVVEPEVEPSSSHRKGDPVISWESIWSFSTGAVSKKFKRHAPVTWSFFANFVGLEESAASTPATEQDSEPNTSYRPKELVSNN